MKLHYVSKWDLRYSACNTLWCKTTNDLEDVICKKCLTIKETEIK